MADKGSAGISAKILKDFVKARLSGNLEYEPADSTEKWVYKIHNMTNSAAVILTTSDEFYGQTSTDSLEVDDNVLWIAIKHSGTSDGANATNDGVLVNFSGTDPAWNGVDGSANNSLLIVPNELLVLKFAAAPSGTAGSTEVENIKARAVSLTGNKTNSTVSGSVQIHIAAIIDNEDS